MLTYIDNGAYSSITTEEAIDALVARGEVLYNLLDDGKSLVWFDGKEWIFPRPIIEQTQSASMYSNEMLEVLNQINEKMTELTENLQS